PEPEPDVTEEEVVVDAPPAEVDHGAPDLDWGEIEAREITLFLPGQASIEWMQDGSEHGGGRALGFGDRCLWCHQGEEAEFGELVTSGEGVESEDLGDKRGHLDMTVQAAFDDDYLYMRFEWEDTDHAPLPFVDDGRMDPDNPVKLNVSFADNQPDLAAESGCWASCHHDSRHMPDHPDAEAIAESDLAERLDLSEGVTKYLAESRTEIEIRGRRGAARGGWDKLVDEDELQALREAGVYLDIARFKSGDDRTELGHVLEQREFADSEAVQFTGELDDGVWTVYMTRALRPGEDMGKALDTNQLYNLGIALHDDYASSRFHHVSWQYGLTFGAEIPGDFDDDMVEFNAQRVGE
uniref:ethylbenzene dehydrogenase-related protein n=1 Tax=Aquisalimonas sp. TaxID=1872621 RepID=UPI0025BD4389